MSHHPTPDLSHLKAADYRNVYEPAEDTFLFLDALEKEKEFLEGRDPTICLEIGWVGVNETREGCFSIYGLSIGFYKFRIRVCDDVSGDLVGNFPDM